MARHLVLDIEGLSTEEQQSVEDTLNEAIDNMTEEQQVKYMHEIRATFSATNSIRRTDANERL